MRIARWTSVAVLLAVAGCGSDDEGPKDVAGDYVIGLTNGPNGCMLANWMMGQTHQGMRLLITQDAVDRTKITGQVQGVEAAVLGLWLLTQPTFVGTVTGSNLNLTLDGRRSENTGTCTFTTAARIEGISEGDTVRGTVFYLYRTNGTADCQWRTSCTTEQSFNGSRPPTGR